MQCTDYIIKKVLHMVSVLHEAKLALLKSLPKSCYKQNLFLS